MKTSLLEKLHFYFFYEIASSLLGYVLPDMFFWISDKPHWKLQPMGDVTGYSQIIAKGTWSWSLEPTTYSSRTQHGMKIPLLGSACSGSATLLSIPTQGTFLLPSLPAHSMEWCWGHSRDTGARAGAAPLAVHQGHVHREWHLVTRAADTENLSTFISQKISLGCQRTFWHSNKSQPYPWVKIWDLKTHWMP